MSPVKLAGVSRTGLDFSPASYFTEVLVRIGGEPSGLLAGLTGVCEIGLMLMVPSFANFVHRSHIMISFIFLI